MVVVFQNHGLPQRDSRTGTLRKTQETWSLSHEGFQLSASQSHQRGEWDIKGTQDLTAAALLALTFEHTEHLMIQGACATASYCTKLLMWIILFNPRNRPLRQI